MEKPYKTLLEGIPIPVVVWRRNGSSIVLEEHNPAAERFLKIFEIVKDIISVRDLFHPDSETFGLLTQSIQSRTSLSREAEYRMTSHPNAGIARVTVFPLGDDLHALVLEDITDLRKAQDALERASRTDALTGLANRRVFRETLEAEHSRTRRYGRPYSVLLADIDHYKDLNDAYGHAYGDQVLVRVGDLIVESLRDHDLVARWGGEEFSMLLPETESVEAKAVAEKLRTTLESAELHATVSIGGAVNDGSQDPERTLIAADTSLQKAKKMGRNRVEFL